MQYPNPCIVGITGKSFSADINRKSPIYAALNLGLLFVFSDKVLIFEFLIVSVSAMLVYTVKKNVAQVFILERYFLFPFVRQQVPVLAWRCSRRQRRCLVDDVRYIFKEVDALQPA